MTEGRNILNALQRRWMIGGLLFCLLLTIAVSLLLTTLLRWWGYDPLWVVVICSVAAGWVSLWLFPSWRVTVADTARILDKYLPELEESSGLLLLPEEELGGLQRLQAARIGQRLTTAKLPRPLQRRLLAGICLVGAMVLLSWMVPVRRSGNVPVRGPVPTTIPKPAPAGVETVNILVTPPAYTGRLTRRQQEMNLQVEEGALIKWEITTNAGVDSLQLVFNDSSVVACKPVDATHTIWRLSRTGSSPGFYQLKLNGRLSDLYKLEVIRDEAPRVSIRSPKAYTIVDIGESRRIPMIVKVQDDYGISDARIVATIATGAGEAVKFKEQVLSFGVRFPGGQTVYDLQQVLNLDALGLHPGDELYYYCKAKDNHGQETRSDMYIISLPDTARLMSLDGLTSGLDIKPELFRSERQIIIETEQLLRGRDSMSVQAFNNKSNDLGIDQKLLRLRYGKFLGEEAEEGGSSEGFSAAGAGPGDFGDAAKVRDAFTDKHDNAEDATYFEPAIKAQLKATLTEMWNAELRLRTLKPQEALPYEYKALRLLKDLQQRSRAYVAKTGVKMTPLDPKKRLTGKLDEILATEQRGTFDKDISDEDRLRMALSVLDQDRASKASMTILQEAGRQLGRQAAVHPGEYLEGFQALRRVLEGGNKCSDRELAQQAIKKMLATPEADPSIHTGAPDGGLSRLYFNNIKRQ